MSDCMVHYMRFECYSQHLQSDGAPDCAKHPKYLSATCALDGMPKCDYCLEPMDVSLDGNDDLYFNPTDRTWWRVVFACGEPQFEQLTPDEVPEDLKGEYDGSSDEASTQSATDCAAQDKDGEDARHQVR